LEPGRVIAIDGKPILHLVANIEPSAWNAPIRLSFPADELDALAHRIVALLNDADEVTSGRFLGAIASIMLFPTFIVGLYGMNFETMPELRWPLGYAFAGALIVVTTVAQVSYFRRKRWL
jgi:magnesium transporter